MTARQKAPPRGRAITAHRAPRLVKLLSLLAGKDRPRAFLIRRLRLDLRGFYRDLDLLRRYGVPIELAEHNYRLGEPLSDALGRLTLPDPQLNLHDAIQLARGRTTAHRKLREFIEGIVGKMPARRRRR